MFGHSARGRKKRQPLGEGWKRTDTHTQTHQKKEKKGRKARGKLENEKKDGTGENVRPLTAG